MTIRTSLAVAAAAGLFALSGAASAKTVEFSFGGQNLAPTPQWVLTEDGVQLTMTAGSFVDGFNFPSASSINDEGGNSVSGYVVGNNNTYDSDAYLDPDFPGVGVINNFSAGTDDDDDVDGSNWDDFLSLAFNVQVRILEVDFGRFGSNDDYRLFYDLSGDNALGEGDFLTFLQNDDPLTNPPLFTDDIFGFAATSSNDEWVLKKIKVEVIPLPAAGWMLLAGVGGLIALGRRKSG